MYGFSECFQGAVQLLLLTALQPLYLLALAVEWLSSIFTARVKVPPPKVVLITGAGSGLGRQFAIHYAKQGATHLALLDLSQKALDETVASCAAAGATCETFVADVTNAELLKSIIEGYDARHPLDLVLANAGVAESTIGAMYDVEKAGRVVTAVNVVGVVNTVLPAIAVMRPRGRGQVALVSSQSAFLTYWPQAPTYAASKAYVKSWGLGLRAHFWRTGIRINVLAPYFINTPMVQAVAVEQQKQHVKVMPIPGLMKTEKAVAHMADGLARDKAVTTMPMIPLIMISLVHAVPLAVTDILMRNNFLRSPFWGYVANDNEISKTPCIAAATLATAVLPPAVEGTTAAGAAGGAASGAGAVVDHGAASGDEAASGSGGVRHRKRSASQSRA